MQISTRDAFFNPAVINFTIIKDLFDNWKENKHTDASWRCLVNMMVRDKDSTSTLYNKQSDSVIKAGIGRLHALVTTCLDPLHGQIPVPEAKSDWADTAGITFDFMIRKVEMLSAANITGGGSKGNGLHFLQRRMWETMIAMLVMHYSEWREKKIVSMASNPAKGAPPVVVERKKKDVEVRELWQSPGSKLTNQQWGKHRMCCMGSAAVFFAFGPAGWWTCFTDQNKFNNKSIVGMVNIAKHKHAHLLTNGNSRQHPNPFNPNPVWANIEAMIYSCLADIGIQKDGTTADLESVNWHSLTVKWSKKLSEESVVSSFLCFADAE